MNIDTENEGVELEQQDDQTEHQEVDDGIDEATGLEYAEEARMQGWVPKEEFRGAPGAHKSAKEFVEHGKNILPVMRNNIDRMSKKMDEQERMIKAQASAYERQIKGQQDELERKKIEAVELGDVDTYKDIEKRQQNLRPVETYEAPDETLEAVNEFKSRNAWSQDPVNFATANAISGQIAQNQPNLTVHENLAAVEREMKRRSPHLFDDEQPAQRKRAPSVESGRRSMPKKSDGFAALPQEAKAAFAKMHKRGGPLADMKEADAKAYYVKQYGA